MQRYAYQRVLYHQATHGEVPRSISRDLCLAPVRPQRAQSATPALFRRTTLKPPPSIGGFLFSVESGAGVTIVGHSTMNHMDILAKLFGSPSRVKLMRLFLMNPEDVFDKTEMGKRSKITGTTLQKEIRMMEDIGLIKSRTVIKMKPKSNGKNGPLEKRKVAGFGMDSTFPYLAALRSLVTEIALGKEDVSARFRNCGQLKLIIVAGVFIDEADSRVDVLLVGDKMKKPIIEGVLRRLEAELGKELTYGLMETTEFEYRFGIYDKFIRDIIDYPHLVVLNKLNLF
jgi:hypothetical protein